MDKNEYVRLVELIISSEDIPEEEKMTYLQILDIVKKAKSNDLKNYEDSTYTTRGKVISDEDRINYEINRIYKTALEDYIMGGEETKEIELALKKLAYRNDQPKKTSKEKQEIKKELTIMQIYKGLSHRFFTAFPDVVRQLEKDADKEMPTETKRTFSK